MWWGGGGGGEGGGAGGRQWMSGQKVACPVDENGLGIRSISDITQPLVVNSGGILERLCNFGLDILLQDMVHMSLIHVAYS